MGPSKFSLCCPLDQGSGVQVHKLKAWSKIWQSTRQNTRQSTRQSTRQRILPKRFIPRLFLSLHSSLPNSPSLALSCLALPLSKLSDIRFSLVHLCLAPDAIHISIFSLVSWIFSWSCPHLDHILSTGSRGCKSTLSFLLILSTLCSVLYHFNQTLPTSF